jgi:cytosine/adenosine deaminase-related metal-dependent hydrolase
MKLPVKHKLPLKRMEKMDHIDLLVRGGWVVPAHDLAAIQNGAVAVSDGKIVDIGPYEALSTRLPPPTKEIGGPPYLVIPGLINAHSHGRGLSDFQRGGLDNTLESWRLNSATYVPVSLYDDVAYSAIRMLRSGVTTCMHNHLMRDASDFRHQFETAIQAYRDVGLRVLFCPGVRNANPFIYGDNDRFRKNLTPEILQELTSNKGQNLDPETYFEAVRELQSEHTTPFTRIGYGPVAPQWCTSELLQAVKKEASQVGATIHLHTLQTVFQKVYALKTHGKSYIAYLKDIGLLEDNLILGHCVFPTQDDIELLAASGTGVTHHPSCNLRQRNGISPVYSMLSAGVTVGLGMDGKGINDDDDFIQEMKVCRLLHRLSSMELDSDCLSNRQILKMGTENAAHLTGFSGELGRLEPGRFADLVLLDYESMTHPFTDPSHDPVDVLLYRGHGRYVDTVVIHGEVALENGRVMGVDETMVAKNLAQAAKRPRSEEELRFKEAINGVRAQIVNYFQGWPQMVDFNPFYRMNSRTDGFKKEI